MLNWLQYIFGYSTDPAHAFFFNRYDFWLFFTVMYAIFTLVYKKTRIRNIYLTLFSLFFYYKSGGLYFLLLIFSTLVDYNIGRLIYGSDNEKRRKYLLAASVIINLGVLAYFKYAGFFIDSLNNLLGTHFVAIDIFAQMANSLSGSHFNIENIFLPIGISFYTFQTISYSIDVYRRQVKPVNDVFDFAFYVSFFPQLVAGPIVRASSFVPQIYKPYSVSRADVSRALILIMAGMIKKILIADYLGANFVGAVFDDPAKYTGFQNLTAVYGFALQIYGDFSGYSDIAIGIGLLLGFRLPLNFNSPYKAINIRNFWQRWHISLSTWLRDYLYIPLGGNRHGKWKTYKNLMLTMLLGGLWHGAAWRFIIWGALHGAGLSFHRYLNEIFPSKNKIIPIWKKLVYGFITFHFVCFAWIFFAAGSMDKAISMIRQITTHFYWSLIPDVVSSYKSVFAVLLIGFILHFIPREWKNQSEHIFNQFPLFAQAMIIALVAFGLFQVMSAQVQPFIYFQF